jgi:hypothetical protein
MVARRCRWLRRAALAMRLAVIILTLAFVLIAGVLTGRALGAESPWVWTVAFLAALAGGVLMLGNPRLNRIADRIEQAAQQNEDRSREAGQSTGDDGHG